MPTITYRRAGVDVLRAASWIESIKPLAKRTYRPGVLRGIGGFGGLFEMGGWASKDGVLVASADGVGTKLRIAQRVGRYDALGVDLVAMNVNDILCAGAQPLFFLDYVAAGSMQPKVFTEIIRGIVRGCRESRCALLGGETAQMPLLYRPQDFDLAGFAVGVVRRSGLVTGERIRPGDVLLGLASSGPHANGLTLAQKVFSVPEQKRFSRELLKATRIYVRPVLDLLRRALPIHGMAHITGGSFAQKLGRILPPGRSAVLERMSWPIPPIFRRIQGAGVSEEEMYRTFNMGIGFVLVIPSAAVPKAQSKLKDHSLRSWVIGRIVAGRPQVVWR